MKNSNKCPKCNSSEIYSDESFGNRGGRSAIGISNWSRIFVTAYVCTNCGLVEEYVDKRDLENSKKIDKIKKNWKKKSRSL